MAYATHSSPVRPVRWAVRGIVLVLAVAIGLTASAATPGVTITKLADRLGVVPGQTVTYTILVHATRGVTVTVTDTLPYGVEWAGNLWPPEASYVDGQVTWSGALIEGEVANIHFDVRAVEPETIGPLPIVNTACADDGTEKTCSSVVVCSNCRKILLPFIARN
jgi:uncharacterized repeat protein (TIGR01451 family)